eukprot:g3409.t1
MVSSTFIVFATFHQLRVFRFDSNSAMDAVSQNQEMTELDLNDPLFKTDAFMVYGFKVLPCRRTRRHDWRECPFAHPGEVARRRDPRLYTYVGIICPDAKQNAPCPRGDNCPYTHSLFEYWLHPTRYKTEFCSRGRQCTRPFCFFAHSETEVRPVDSDALLAVAMRTSQMNTNHHQQHQVQHQSSPVLDTVAQTAELLQKMNLYQQSPIRRMDPPLNTVPLMQGNLSFLKPETGQSTSGSSQSLVYPAEWGLGTGTALGVSLGEEQLTRPDAELSWDARQCLSTPDCASLESDERLPMTDEILSRLGADYLQCARRLYNHRTTSFGNRDADFTPQVPTWHQLTSPVLSMTTPQYDLSSPVLANSGKSCNYFDSGLLDSVKLHPTEAEGATSSASEIFKEAAGVNGSIQLSLGSRIVFARYVICAFGVGFNSLTN